MIYHSNRHLPVCRFENLSAFEDLFHGVYTRFGGVSDAPYSYLNIAYHIGDNSEHVRQNRNLIREDAGVGQLLFIHQVHDRKIFILSSNELQKMNWKEKPPTADAVISDSSNIGLTVSLADCQVVMLYDPAKKVIANIHSGWRGSIQNIIGHTVARMVDVFGCCAADLFAGIGPSLGPCCAEFVNYRDEIPKFFWPYRTGNHHFDFWTVSRDQLIEAGLQSGQIEISGICTKCDTERFYSYRGEKITGRFAAVIALR